MKSPFNKFVLVAVYALGLCISAGSYAASAETNYVTSDSLDFRKSNRVISTASKFIIPVDVCKSELCDEFIIPGKKPKVQLTDYEGGVPLEGKGIVFWNGKDSCWQGARADEQVDGGSVIILNNLSQETAQQVLSHISASLDLSVEDFISQVKANNKLGITVPKLKEVLEHIRSTMRIDDMYDSTVKYVNESMTPVGTESWGTESCPLGLYQRNRDVCQAIYVPGTGAFQGPAATPQKFENGAVILKQGEQEPRLVQPKAFVETYTNDDGSQIDWLPGFDKKD